MDDAPGSSYVICSDGDMLVIDPPLAHEAACRCLKEALESIPCKPSAVQIFFTHLHTIPEHICYGGFSTRPLVYISRVEQPGAGAACRSRCYRQEGFPQSEPVEEKAAEAGLSEIKAAVYIIRLADGDVIESGRYSYRCIHTPGHTAGHMCLYLKEAGLLFSGDTVLFEQLPCVSLWDPKNRELEKMLESLQKLKALQVNQVFPSHGSIEGSFPKRLEEIGNQYYFRLLQMYRLVYDHPASSAYELSRYFYRETDNWADALPQKKQHALEETLSFLNYLRSRNYVATRRNQYGIVNLPGKNKLTDN